jgi:hypothetical protein
MHIDDVARLAVLEAVSAFLEQSPEGLSSTEREAIIGAKLRRAFHDHMDCFVRNEADLAFKSALSAVNEMLQRSDGSTECSTDDSENDDLAPLSARAAARLLHDRRR